jgi:pyruvate,water dikinase
MAERVFEAPGPGTWELERTHVARPVSLYAAQLMSDQLARGFQYGTERFGLLLSHIRLADVHGFSYYKRIFAFSPEDAPAGPPPEGYFEMPELVARMEAGRRAIENKLWREDLRRWDEEVKPDSIRRNDELQAVDVGSLDIDGLVKHLETCRDNVALMWFRHHEFTIPSILPTGLYLCHIDKWTDLSSGEALLLLKGSTPVSTGLAADELTAAAAAMRAAGVNAAEYRAQPPDAALDALSKLPGAAGAAVRAYVEKVAYQLVSGYDILESYALEMPEVLVGALLRALQSDTAADDSDAIAARRAEVRAIVPEEHREQFDELLDEARLINRLRDERGVYNEARAFGLARRAILEAGRRLAADGRLHDANALVHASHEEMLDLLAGGDGPGEAELRKREAWWTSKTVEDAPPFLGPAPLPPPPPEALPEAVRVGEAAIIAALGNVFDSPLDQEPEGEVVSGLPVSPGIYEGTARLIRSPTDFHRLQQGDVLITKNTSAAFNVVLPVLGAIVTDRGGQLSHAAIIAREYGIPGVVSTRNASQAIPDGTRVRVDGGAGTVEVVS